MLFFLTFTYDTCNRKYFLQKRYITLSEWNLDNEEKHILYTQTNGRYIDSQYQAIKIILKCLNSLVLLYKTITNYIRIDILRVCIGRIRNAFAPSLTSIVLH